MKQLYSILSREPNDSLHVCYVVASTIEDAISIYKEKYEESYIDFQSIEMICKQHANRDTKDLLIAE